MKMCPLLLEYSKSFSTPYELELCTALKNMLLMLKEMYGCCLLLWKLDENENNNNLNKSNSESASYFSIFWSICIYDCTLK